MLLIFIDGWSPWGGCEMMFGECGNGFKERTLDQCFDGSNKVSCDQIDLEVCYEACQGNGYLLNIYIDIKMIIAYKNRIGSILIFHIAFFYHFEYPQPEHYYISLFKVLYKSYSQILL